MSDYLYKIYSGARKIHRPINYQKQYTCKQCPFKTTSLLTLTQHTNFRHTKKGPLDPFQCSRNPPESYTCYYCHFKTALLLKYNEHVEKTKHVNQKHKPSNLVSNHICVKCKFETYSRLILLKHVSTGCVDNRDLTLASLQAETTENCIEVYQYNLQTLQASLVSGEVPKPASVKAKCNQCGQQLNDAKSLKFHKILKHTSTDDVRWLECSKCFYKTNLRYEFVTHMISKHRDEDEARTIYKCSLCLFRHRRPEEVKKHYTYRHTSEKDRAEGAEVEWFTCKFCPHKTRWRQHLKRHELQQHQQGDFEMVQCEHCPYRAKQKIHMKLHVAQKHTPDAEVVWFRCDKCDYKAKLKASLKSHVLKKHTSSDKIDWFVCDKCGFKALERSLLKKHVEKKH